MNAIRLFDEDYSIAIYSLLFITFGVPFILFLIGLSYRKKSPKTAKTFFIITGVYILISLGICGTMML